MPKISIIVPIYNVEEYLDCCLESLVNQTYRDIEIICVDDKSTDSSAEILRAWEKKDSRIKAIYLETNSGTSYARKVAGLASTGDYIMFCDADDAFLPNACETVAWEMESNPVDILHFRSEIELVGTFDQEKVNSLARLLEPWNGTYHGDNLVAPCYKEKKWFITLWNKAYNGPKSRMAFSKVGTARFCVATDVYLFFLLSFYCQSYRGIGDKLNKYRFGAGVTGYQSLDLLHFKKMLGRLDSLDSIDAFLDEVNGDASCRECARMMRNDLEGGIIKDWKSKLSPVEKYAGYVALAERMGAEKAISLLAADSWWAQGEIIPYLVPEKKHIEKGKNVKRIGVYYPSVRNGGAQRVVTELLYIYKELGYEVILITEEPAQEDDYPYPPDIVRVLVPEHSKSVKEKYQFRARAWARIIEQYELDTIVYNLMITFAMLWDFCMLKACGVNLIAFSHGIFCGALWYSVKLASNAPFIYRLADRIICLSRMDKHYWDAFSKAYFIPNPQQLCLREQMADLDSKNIVWVGRLSNEKQPDDMLKIFSIVHKAIPEATLTYVGDGTNDFWRNKLQNMASSLSLEDAVEFTGFQDPTPYYQRASVLAFTSRTEGWPLVISESKTYGLPLVMYDLPWLEFVRDGRGIVTVPQNDVQGMAARIIELLENDELRKQQGKLARESIEEMVANVAPMWKEVLESFGQTYELESTLETRLMLNQLHKFMYAGVKNLESQLANAKPNAQASGLTTGERLAISRHEEVVNRHEEVVNRHEEVVNRHNDSINHQWEVQKWHEERLRRLEGQASQKAGRMLKLKERVMTKLGLRN